MAQPMPKEESRSEPDRSRGVSPIAPELRAKAAALERKLGRPLRLEIEGPLTDEESEEVLLARLMDHESWISAEEFLAKYGRG